MEEANSAAEGREATPGSTDYTRFMILCDARTGSNMLAQALNSSPSIICFREVLNHALEGINYAVEGYDGSSPEDIALRRDDPSRFLDERIFCRHPEAIRAVGFKMLYSHFFGFEGVLGRLAEDTGIRVLHLRRRNLLRTLVSYRIAETTGVWVKRPGPKLTPARMLRAALRPSRVAARLWGLLRPPETGPRAPRAPVTLSVEECWRSFNGMQSSVAHCDHLFRAHPKLNVYYEDLLQRRDEVFDQAQAFVGVEPGPLTVTLRRQNPEPLRKLVENYDELHEAFRGTPYEVFFE